MITYEDYKKEIYQRAINKDFKGIPKEKVLSFLNKHEAYIKDKYESATSEEKYRAVYGNKPDFAERLECLKRGDFLESNIEGTLFGLDMMWE